MKSDHSTHFVRTILEGDEDVRPFEVVRSPVFWIAVLLVFGAALPGIGEKISWTDNGELVTVAQTLGIAHPTGYPLLTLVSRFMLVISGPMDPLIVLNLFSALCVAVAAGLVACITVLVIGSFMSRPRDAVLVSAAACSGALLFATGSTVWLQAVSYEVYGFQVLLYAAALFSLLLSLRPARGNERTISEWWILSGLLFGFGFANHMMTIFLIPAAVWLTVRRRGWPTKQQILSFALPAAGGISLYGYLLVRSGSDPLMNWGDPSTIAALVSHTTASQYRIWMFSGMDAFLDNAYTFLASFPQDVGWFASAAGLMGCIVLWNRGREMFWFMFLLAVTTLVYSFNYSIHDIETYYLLVHIVVSITASVALWGIMRWMIDRWPDRRRVVALVLFLLVALNLILVRMQAPGVDDESPEPFALGVLQHVDPNASIITGAWDFLYSPALALQHVRGVRPDVRMIDLHLLRDRSWYVRSVLRRYMGDRQEIQRSGQAFLLQLRRFESGEAFNPAVIQQRWQSFLGDLVRTLDEMGPVYVDHEVVRELPAVLSYQPDGYLLRGYKEGEKPDYVNKIVYHPIGAKNDDFAQYYRSFCASAFINHGLYALSQGDTATAERMEKKARSIDPVNPLLTVFH